MKSIDLSKFKKISSDKHSTVLKSKDGHELKIAHSNLSPKMRLELSKLPVYKAEGGDTKAAPKEAPKGPEIGTAEDRKKIQDSFNSALGLGFADGGDVEEFAPGKDYSKESLPGDQNSTPHQAPVVINVGNQPSPGSMPKGPDVNSDLSKLGSLIAPLLENRTNIPDSVRKDPSLAPGLAPLVEAQNRQKAAEPAPTAATPITQASQPEQRMQNEQLAAPLAAPSGIPAPVTEMRPRISPVEAHKEEVKKELTTEDKDWEQDLQNGHIKPETYNSLFAKKSVPGKIATIFGLLVSGAGAGLTRQPNALLQLMQKEIDSDLEAQKQSKNNAQNYLRLNQQKLMNEAQTKQVNIDTESKAYALAQSQMLQSSYHNLVQNVNKMPEGPQKESAKQQLAMVYAGVRDKISNINDQAAGASAYQNMLFGNSNGGSGSEEQSFQKQTSGMRMLGPQGEKRAEDLESKHFPGLKGQASVPLSGGDRDALNSGIEFDKKLGRFIDWTKNHSGDINPSAVKEGRTLAAELQGAYRQATHGGVYKEGEQNFISKIIDSEPTKFFNEIRVLPSLNAVAKENQARVNQLAQSKGFSGYSSSQSVETKSMNGAEYRKVPGGWQKVK